MMIFHFGREKRMSDLPYFVRAFNNLTNTPLKRTKSFHRSLVKIQEDEVKGSVVVSAVDTGHISLKLGTYRKYSYQPTRQEEARREVTIKQGGACAKKSAPSRIRRRRYEPLATMQHEIDKEEHCGDTQVTPQNDQKGPEQVVDELEQLTLPLTASAGPSRKGQNQCPTPSIRSIITERANKFESSSLLQVKEEIRELMKTQMWMRVVQHSPFSCILLKELFEEQLKLFDI